MAVASGARGLAAVVVLDDAEGDPAQADLAVARDLAGGGCPVHAVTARGDLRATVTT